MLNRILGEGTRAAVLKSGLDASSRRVRDVASRVANASNPDFASELEAAQSSVDVEKEMVTLADEQLRYEAATRLLEKTYAQLRASVRER